MQQKLFERPMPERPLVVSMFDFTGIASDPWRDKGYEVAQLDLLLGHDLDADWRDRTVAVIGQPPCTDLTKAGAWMWEEKGEHRFRQALYMFGIPFWVAYMSSATRVLMVENPAGRATRVYGKPKYYQPWEYALLADTPESEHYRKLTGVWGHYRKPNKCPWGDKDTVDTTRIVNAAPGPDRGLRRSVAPQGLWRALCEAQHDGDTLLDSMT